MGAMGAILSVVGGVVQGMGAMQAHEAEAKAHEYNAAVDTRNIAVIEQQGQAQLEDQALANLRDLHAIRGMFAANGVSFTGSATDVVLDTVKAQTLGQQRTAYATRLKVIQTQDDRNLELMGASAERQAGSISMISGIIGGLSGGLNQMTRTA